MKRRWKINWILFSLLIVASCQKANNQGSTETTQSPRVPSKQLPQLLAGVHEQTTSLPEGGILRYTVSIPEKHDPPKQAPLVVILHYGGDVTPFYGREMIDELVAPAFKDIEAVLVAPDSLGGDWTTQQNEQAVLWLTKNIIKSYAIDPKKVVLTGYSMGGKGTWFIASRNQDLFTAAIPIAGEPVGGSNWKIPLLVIHSQDDEVIPLGPTQSHVNQLKEKGVKVEFRKLTGLTHFQTPQYAPALRDALPWLKQVWK